MNKNVILLSFLLLFSIMVKAQIYNPIKWKTSVEKISDTEYELQIKAIIDNGWHLYSQNVSDGGPIPTHFNFAKSPDFQLVGEVKEEKGKTIQDPVFKMPIKFFEKETTFKQRMKVISSKPFKIKTEVEFMVCNDENCLPPSTEEIEFTVKPSAEKPANKIAEKAVEKTPINEVLADSSIVSKTSNTLAIKAVAKESKEVIKEVKKPIENKTKSFLGIFILAFLSGFAALLTPCVFPMIPMTVSYFTKQSKTKAAGIRNALIYGFSIVIIYVLLGSIVTAIFGADSLNALSTNVWFNIIFFILLVVFACSFLGAFEIMLPNTLANKVDSQADKGGLIGIFCMALALAIVSFSCTGPIVGTLLVEAASKGGIAPIVGMLGFSIAIALPFSLFAAFPGWLNALPKSGGWLNTVKVVLGFLELALAFKFLSNADLVLQLHWLQREVFLTIWIAIFGILALYLFGKITLPHDSPLNHISVGRLALGILVLSFTIYLIPGLFGAPLKLISGFPPPMHYSESPDGFGISKSTAEIKAVLPEGAEYGPQDLITFHDYDKGMEFAKKAGKPVLLDFTGYACVNCRKMEELVWSESKVLSVLKNDLILISLYVDDKKELPENEQYISKATGKKIKTIGNKWSDLQIKTYKANAQPFYALVDHNSTNLTKPSAYNPDSDDYYNWLSSGIRNFKKG
ncbi:protein-disulfide reductase DsbD family protein [Flavobacterium pectinovorum]|uniref:Thiol:disulfide interchange protein n=1 Tax=Flavobacterium pectinovorum TaxID=29533 RepID=A0A502F7A1_9FLAO|nr:cytochrome c biogenesis protein CcdA [Flavobacterium pectinovorum]TPG45245.1 thiol:disulfide interchange protein [Flavobacterium pectinovorum]